MPPLKNGRQLLLPNCGIKIDVSDAVSGSHERQWRSHGIPLKNRVLKVETGPDKSKRRLYLSVVAPCGAINEDGAHFHYSPLPRRKSFAHALLLMKLTHTKICWSGNNGRAVRLFVWVFLNSDNMNMKYIFAFEEYI